MMEGMITGWTSATIAATKLLLNTSTKNEYSIYAGILTWRRVVHTGVHSNRHIQKQMKGYAIYENNGYKIVEHPGRIQPYTLWRGEHVIYFAATFGELEQRMLARYHGR